MVQFPNKAAYASANNGHSSTALLGIFSFWFTYIIYKSLLGKIKSCILNPEFYRMNREFNLGATVLSRYLSQFQADVTHIYALLVSVCSSRSEIQSVLYFRKFSTASGGLCFSKVS